MERNRQTKVLVIIALVLAICGMTLGFAAFSSTLNISSSATVTPNSNDFKVVVYGATNYDDINWENFFETDVDMTKWSYDYAVPIDRSDTGLSATNATIDNTNFIVSNMSAEFIEPSTFSIGYIFLIKNEGEYGTYISIPQYLKDQYLSGEHMGTCTPGDGATKELVQEACEGIFAGITSVINSNGENISNYLVDPTASDYMIGVGDYVLVSYEIGYEGEARADGPFSVKFEDFKITFSTAPSK